MAKKTDKVIELVQQLQFHEDEVERIRTELEETIGAGSAKASNGHTNGNGASKPKAKKTKKRKRRVFTDEDHAKIKEEVKTLLWNEPHTRSSIADTLKTKAPPQRRLDDILLELTTEVKSIESRVFPFPDSRGRIREAEVFGRGGALNKAERKYASS